MPERVHSDRWKGYLAGLCAAALFGLSAPASKLLLPDVGVLPMASLLYLGAGIAVGLLGPAVRGRPSEARLTRADLAPLLGIILLGGAAGPWLMLSGLSRVSGVTGALLLNLEAPFTILIAWAAFREHVGAQLLGGAALIVAGAAFLGAGSLEVSGSALGALLVAASCAAWAIDNNLTQKLSVRDPISLVRTKGLGAGALMAALAFAFGERVPPLGDALKVLALGAVSYGASILLDVYALRWLGAAREAAIFATAPFFGAVAATLLLPETIGRWQAVAMAAMVGGVYFLVRERHGHRHAHEALEHDHVHVHDAHHQHDHPPGVDPAEPHAHPHRHAPLVHDHPHVSDVHHRHTH